MNGPQDTAAGLVEPARRPALATVSTLLVQALGSLCIAVPSVLAPAIAPSLGHAPERVGVFVGLAYFAAMVAGLWSGRGVAMVGAVGLSQAALVSFAAGMALVTAGSGVALIAVALLMGAGYGIINPSAAALLNQHAPPAHRALLFSVKQSGVPIGVAGAGVLMPLGLAVLGWQSTLWVVAAVCGLYALALTLARRPLEPGRYALDQVPAGKPGSLARVFKDPSLRLISIASFAFAFSQLCFMTFLVSFLNLELGHPLALAAGVLAASQVVSTVGRIGWGVVADRWIAPGRLLGWLGIGAGLSFVGLGTLGHLPGEVPTGWIIAAAMVCALTSMSWNGVFFAELARLAGRGEMASIAGASQAVTFCGSMAGPIVFSELIRYGVGYGNAYWTVALLPVAAGVAMLRR